MVCKQITVQTVKV